MSNIEFISELEQIIATRRTSGDEESYTNSLFEKGTPYIAQKVGEEAVELAIAAVLENRNETIAESADLLYHLLVLLNASNLKLGDVAAELENRQKNRKKFSCLMIYISLFNDGSSCFLPLAGSY